MYTKACVETNWKTEETEENPVCRNICVQHSSINYAGKLAKMDGEKTDILHYIASVFTDNLSSHTSLDDI